MKHKNVYLIGAEDLTFDIIERIITPKEIKTKEHASQILTSSK